MLLFLSTFQNKVDKKGRVSVPATFRAALAPQSFPGIIAFRSFTSACIEGCGMDFMENLSSRTDQFDLFSAEQDDFTSLIFADARQLAWDPEGRIGLPEDLTAHAGITDTAAFVGKGRTFQIWNPEAYRAASEEARQRALRTRLTLPAQRPEGGPA
ncbi:MAG: division/cell wall cluster transcriptional repressor MraZ [Rhodospirillales bacterium]|nr:division/cell wall cluster transcriptional repressor MraZ [Rhodospirillales bacterium]